MSNSVRPHRRQPTRLLCPWDSPGKNTGVGCHFRLQCMKVKSQSEVAQSCPTPSDPMNYSLPGSSVHGIFQARVLEWVAVAFSARSMWGPPIPALNPCLLHWQGDSLPLCNLATSTSYGIPATTTTKSLQLCPTLCDPIDGSPPGSPIPGILQARTLEWVAISVSNA